MLKEVRDVRQVPGEPRRRWFTGEVLDLIVWEDEDRRLRGFQVCYRVDDEEKALTWMEGRGFTHNRVDDGEDRPARHKMTPVLVPDGTFDAANVLTQFLTESRALAPELVEAVAARLRGYPDRRVP